MGRSMFERMTPAMTMHLPLHWDASLAPAVLAAILAETDVKVESPAGESDEACDPLPIIGASTPPVSVIEVVKEITHPVYNVCRAQGHW